MTEIDFRPARAADVPAVVAMLADDALGASRESPEDLTPYEQAFRELEGDPHQLLAVAEREGTVVATLQLTVVPGLSRKATKRAVIEGVRVHSAERGSGLGTRLIEWAVQEARRRGCGLVQLTSDKARPEAHAFYERLGFVPSHVGFKRPL